MPLRPRHARVARRADLPDQAQLLERRLELGARHPPLDPLRRGHSRFDRRPLPVAAEVRAQARPQVARPADVEHLVVAAEEEVDAGAGRRAVGEMALVEQPPCSRRRKGREVGDRPRAAFLREADQREQQLGGGAGVRERTVARPLARVEKPRELTETEARYASGEQRPREPHGVDDRRADAAAGQELGLAVEEGEVEARVVRHEDSVACEGEEASHGLRRPRCATELGGSEPGHRARPGVDRKPRVDERLELGVDLEPAHAHRPDLADSGAARPQPRRLEVDDDVRRVLEQQRRARRLGERDRVAAPREPGVGLDDVREERARQSDRRLPEGEEPARRVLGEHRPALLLHELHEPIGRV